MLKTVTPIDNSILVERNFATDSEIETVLQNAYDARKEWRETSLRERKDLTKLLIISFLSFKEVSFHLFLASYAF